VVEAGSKKTSVPEHATPGQASLFAQNVIFFSIFKVLIKAVEAKTATQPIRNWHFSKQ
jgi:hypothetical protein